ncbi:sugar transferase [Pseudonocardia ailaonensis]|uniref:Sugar transferase n=1 Tax=Pseudonocardia ailaonensis TaxID=367279 RepID=A0ABN2NB80_9PSEU
MNTETEFADPVPGRPSATPTTRAPDTAGSLPRPVSLPRPRWQVRHAWLAAGGDLVAVGASLGLRQWWGDTPAQPDLPLLIGLTLPVLFMVCLATVRAWEPQLLGQGSEEFSRLLRGVVLAGVALALIGLATKTPEVRPWVFGVLPVAGVFAALFRIVLRRRLHRHRGAGSCLHEVLAVGSVENVAVMIERTRRATHHGWQVTGACTPTGRGPDGAADVLGVPVVGDLDSVREVAAAGSYRILSVSQSPGWSSRRLHQLAWDIEGRGVDLVVDPGLMEIAGPRLHMSVVDGMPFLRLTEPSFSGVARMLKNTADRIGSALLLILLAPVLLAVALMVKLDGGPVFYRQTRVGQHSEDFSMIKFRSMVPDADRIRATLVSDDEGAGPLFKMRNDPRITKVGAVLRRYSLDELPQLINVLCGHMSLVGPRPPLPHEVLTYARDAQRRLLVKPGLTGLWQVSGRSDLSWEESVRLDLRYVENWSLALDGLILWKTVGAITRGRGAY